MQLSEPRDIETCLRTVKRMDRCLFYSVMVSFCSLAFACSFLDLHQHVASLLGMSCIRKVFPVIACLNVAAILVLTVLQGKAACQICKRVKLATGMNYNIFNPMSRAVYLREFGFDRLLKRLTFLLYALVVSTVLLAFLLSFPTVGMQGPETWTIDGKKYRIEESYFLPVSDGMQYTIEYVHRFGKPLETVTDEEALQIAFPLMRYAYEHDVYLRKRIYKIGSENITAKRIGVILIEEHGNKSQNYWAGLALGQIAARIRNEKKKDAGQSK
jgi:hypothetical protein